MTPIAARFADPVGGAQDFPAEGAPRSSPGPAPRRMKRTTEEAAAYTRNVGASAARDATQSSYLFRRLLQEHHKALRKRHPSTAVPKKARV